MKSLIKSTALAFAFTLLTLQPAQAGKDIAQDDKVALQLALMEYVDGKTFDGRFLHFDAEKKELLGLYPANLHPMIVPGTGFYFLCADFRDDQGGKVDVDFVATRTEDGFRVIQTMINNRAVVREIMKRNK